MKIKDLNFPSNQNLMRGNFMDDPRIFFSERDGQMAVGCHQMAEMRRALLYYMGYGSPIIYM